MEKMKDAIQRPVDEIVTCGGLYSQWSGQCCCKCRYQFKVCCHPWNVNAPFKGPIGEFFGYGCILFLKMAEAEKDQMESGIIFYEKAHGMCECFSGR